MESEIIGVAVTSRAGRDKGRSFLIVGTADDAHVLLADGDKRKMARPKLKKLKHIHFENARVDISQMPEGGPGAMDSYIRNSLRKLGFNQSAANKEG